MVGLLIGIYGIVSPVATTASQTYNVVPTLNYKVDGNDYHSQGIHLSSGQNVQPSVTMNVSTIFNFMIMNTTQYRYFYGCAPSCRPPFSSGTGIKPATLVNSTVTPSQPYSSGFTSPAADTYYFVFDNSVGKNQSQYQSCFGAAAVCNGPTATGTFSLTGSKPITNYSTNWLLVGPGALLLIVGGFIGMPSSGKKALM